MTSKDVVVDAVNYMIDEGVIMSVSLLISRLTASPAAGNRMDIFNPILVLNHSPLIFWYIV
jgi:hypothetical protein